MKINTKEEYDRIPDGTLLKVFLEGDEWDEDCGEVFTVIKANNRLEVFTVVTKTNNRVYHTGFFYFDEKDELGYEFSIVRPSPSKSREPF